ncbi:MAG TPA: hypothetical protein VGH53_13295, partial [Streptosporangiaceae bacterium]
VPLIQELHETAGFDRYCNEQVMIAPHGFVTCAGAARHDLQLTGRSLLRAVSAGLSSREAGPAIWRKGG